METIEWRTISSMPLYEVSELGIRKIGRTHIIAQILSPKGYFRCSLYKSQRKKDGRRWVLVHRVYAEAFIDRPINATQVNHKNGIKTDNSPSNLEWVTGRENIIHAIKTGISCAKINQSIANEIRGEYALGRTSYKKLSEKYGISKDHVKDIVKGKVWKFDEIDFK